MQFSTDTTDKIIALRQYFGAIQKIDPNSAFYARIERIIYRAPIDAVKAAAAADIKFVSVIARQRLRQTQH